MQTTGGTSTFCITTLTCNDRECLSDTIGSFFEWTDLSWLTDPHGPPSSRPSISGPVIWFIYMQGCSVEFVARTQALVDSLTREHPGRMEFRIEQNPENLGLSKGSNRLAEMSSEFDFVLHLEDDWLCLPSSVTGVGRHWLRVCLSLMGNMAGISTLFLRKYASDQEKWQYGWRRTIPYRNHRHPDNFDYTRKIKQKIKENHVIQDIEGIGFQEIPTFLFTLNPCIRRNSDYYSCGVFPLDEFNDRLSNRNRWEQDKVVEWWGYSESMAMEKIRDLCCLNVSRGIFGHYEDWIKLLQKDDQTLAAQGNCRQEAKPEN